MRILQSVNDHADTVVSTSPNSRTKAEIGICHRKQTTARGFPCLLYETLSDSDKNGYDDIISWLPHGRAFRIHKPKQFSAHVMPTIFRLLKWSSFQRQLNRYGFNRIICGPDKGGYFHESFLRGKPDLVSYVVCTPVKGTKKRRRANPDAIPDFYRVADSKEYEISTMPHLKASTKANDYESVYPIQEVFVLPVGPTLSQKKSQTDEILSSTSVFTLSNDLRGTSEVSDDDLRNFLRSLFGPSTSDMVNKKNSIETDKFDKSIGAIRNETCTANANFCSSSTNIDDAEWEHFMDTAFD